MKRLNIILFLAAMTILTSCLKDGRVNLAPGASPPVVQWATAAIDDAPANSASNIYREYSRTLAIGTAMTMNLQVDLTGTDPAPADITVTIGINNAAAAAYNTKYNGTTPNPVLPTSIYTIPTTVTIPKGAYAATVPIVVNTASASFSLASVYMLPLSITSASNSSVSANYGTVIYLVNAKNAYEADYTVTGYLFHPSSPRAISTTMHMSSNGLTTNTIGFGDLVANGYSFQFTFPAAGGPLTNYTPVGAIPPPPQSGFMTADNPGNVGFPAGPDQPGTAPWVHSTYNNSFDGNKTFYFHVGYASGGNGQNTWSRQLYQKAVRIN